MVVTFLQFLVVEGSRREVKLEPETTVDIGLGDNLVVEVGFCSTSDDTGSIPATEVTASETSTLLATGRNALTPVIGENARNAGSSSINPSKEITRVARLLKD